MIPRLWLRLPMAKAVDAVTANGGRLVFYGIVFAGMLVGVTVRRVGVEGNTWE